MTHIHPLDLLQGYRLGSRQATIELQRVDVPGLHIDFQVLRLVEAVQQGQVKAVILTGTAGDGKTYLAYKIIEILGLDRARVLQAQPSGGFDAEGVFIDLDLSAGLLTEPRIHRLHEVLSTPQRLTLICANEGKLADLEDRLKQQNLAIPAEVLRINLSRRALVSPEAWTKVLAGVLDGPLWSQAELDSDSPLAQNRVWLQNPGIAERLRRYLLLPYLLGEPITIRETLSFLSYALGGGLSAAQVIALTPGERIRYLLFNTTFSEPADFVHGGRATPSEKLLWWLFRFDPAAQASPEVDLKLLVELDQLDVAPPTELRRIWNNDLVVFENEPSDTEYRRRLDYYMRYARRWYALASESGFQAYFPFRYFAAYLVALAAPEQELQKQIPSLVRGLNLLLSGGQVKDDGSLKVFYLPTDGAQQNAIIYGADTDIDIEDFSLKTDLSLDAASEQAGDVYLERLPRRLYLQYDDPSGSPIRLPISLLLYEVLHSIAGTTSGFPATLWVKERDTVLRFMGQLNRVIRPSSRRVKFTIMLDGKQRLNLEHHLNRQTLKVERS